MDDRLEARPCQKGILSLKISGVKSVLCAFISLSIGNVVLKVDGPQEILESPSKSIVCRAEGFLHFAFSPSW